MHTVALRSARGLFPCKQCNFSVAVSCVVNPVGIQAEQKASMSDSGHGTDADEPALFSGSCLATWVRARARQCLSMRSREMAPVFRWRSALVHLLQRQCVLLALGATMMSYQIDGWSTWVTTKSTTRIGDLTWTRTGREKGAHSPEAHCQDDHSHDGRSCASADLARPVF